VCVELDLISNITLILLIIGAAAVRDEAARLRRSLVSDLGGKEVLEYSELIDLELHDQALFLMKTETSEARYGGCFVEHVEVAEGELLGNRLLNLQNSAVLSLLAVVLAELDRARADLTLNCEGNRVGGCGDLHSLTEGKELFADLSVLVGVDGDHGLILSLGDGQMLAVDGDQVEVELSLELILGVLEDDLQVSGLLVSLEGDSVRVVRQLHHLGEVGNRDSQDHVGVSTVALETIHAQV